MATLERWVIGPEHDEAMLRRLGNALRVLGYAEVDAWSAVAGSQDIGLWVVSRPDGELTIECETYVGLSVEGSSSAIVELRMQFDALPSNPSLQRTAFGGR